MIKKTIKMCLVFAFVIYGCQTATKSITVDQKAESKYNFPDDIWLSLAAQKSIDSVFTLASQAHNQLENQDTLGAELTYEFAFEILSGFSEEEKMTMTKWSRYDSTLKIMNYDYDLIYEKQQEVTEAEEVREEITDIEEILFQDSVLYGKETVIDSSGDMPITLNNKVRAAITYFQTKGRPVYTRWLERSGKYEQLVEEILTEHQVPSELKYLAMIESGFNPSARSYARAVGMWQFISATGNYYGLRHNWWFDERRDVIKSTVAAARHLRDLNERFDGDWYLSLAGYNCNPKRVEGNMRRLNTKDYWKLYRLPRQTRNYVPTYLAATIIAKDPRKFGFYVEKQKPVELDTVMVSESIDLNVVAESVDTSYSYIKEINPAVLHWVTPPGVKDFTLYVPKGKKGLFKKAYAEMPDESKRSWVRHKISSGETLSTIADKYHTNMSVLKSVNKISGTTIRAGKYMLIPVPQNKKHFYVSDYKDTTPKSYTRKRSVKSKENLAEYKKIEYLVKKGDTLGEIAENYSTRASKIRSWNGLYYGQNIYPDQKLILYVPKSFGGVSKSVSANNADLDKDAVYYTVRRGDTLWDISKKYNISMTQLKKLNKLNGSQIKPGEKIKVAGS
jgi:peptidoglycan lytic transglycosylase D